MRQMRADHRWSATFPQIKPTKINLSLFGRERCPNEHVGFPGRAAQGVNFWRVTHEPAGTEIGLRASQDCRAANLTPVPPGPGIRPRAQEGIPFV